MTAVRDHARPMRQPVNSVALCGGLASGKSTVAELFERGGWTVVDTDAVAARLRRDPSIRRQIDRALGHENPASSLAADPARLRERMFRCADDRRRVEAVLHPKIRQVVARECAAHPGPEPLLVVVPLLLEAGWQNDFPCIVSVASDVATRTARALSRPGWTRDTVTGILAAQASDDERNAAADGVIDNGDGVTLDVLRRQVDDLKDIFRLCQDVSGGTDPRIRGPSVASGTIGGNPSDGVRGRRHPPPPQGAAMPNPNTARDCA